PRRNQTTAPCVTFWRSGPAQPVPCRAKVSQAACLGLSIFHIKTVTCPTRRRLTTQTTSIKKCSCAIRTSLTSTQREARDNVASCAGSLGPAHRDDRWSPPLGVPWVKNQETFPGCNRQNFAISANKVRN